MICGFNRAETLPRKMNNDHLPALINVNAFYILSYIFCGPFCIGGVVGQVAQTYLPDVKQ